MVKADVAELLQSWKNVKYSITSVERTKHSILKKYQQLSVSWKDKKYRELGSVLQECDKALNSILKTLTTAEKSISLLAKNLQEYEESSLGFSSSRGQRSSGRGELSQSYGSNWASNFFSNVFNRSRDINDLLKGVEYRPIGLSARQRSEQEIIANISGGDQTEGSCSSLAFAYAGNRAGYVVYDFRDGRSRIAFGLRSSVDQIANMEGVDSLIVDGRDDTLSTEQLISSMQAGREYYMATGGHAAIVRLSDEGLPQYLELQSANPEENGWHPLTAWSLSERFGCEDGQRQESSNYLIDLDSLQNNEEFLDLLGYINTDENAQVRGEDGYVR